MFPASAAASRPGRPLAVSAPADIHRSALVLQTLDSEILECYRHAAECTRSANQSCDLRTKQDFLEMQKRWLCLAHSYEFAEQLSNLSKPLEIDSGNPQKRDERFPVR
jgi:hypothetical protein